MSNADTIRTFIEAWSRQDVNELVDYFAVDGTYHNMPLEPVTGHAALRASIGGFITSWKNVDWELTHIAEAGDVVMAERIDRMTVSGKPIALPCVGVFEMQDGKIACWRDYFDMASFTKALQD